MVLSEIKAEIGARVGDKDLDTYSDVVQGYFAQAMANLIRKPISEDNPVPYYEDQITPLLTQEPEEVDLRGGVGEIDLSTVNNLSYVYGLNVDTSWSITRSGIDFKLITESELIDLSQKVDLEEDEGRWSKEGNVITIYVSNSFQTIRIRIRIVENPDTIGWTDDTDFSSYGLGFIYDCIELVARQLKEFIRLGE